MNNHGLELVQIALRRQDESEAGGNWRDRARCLGTDPESFFPTNAEDARIPQKVCSRCEVRVECGEIREPFGIWAGITEWEARRIARRAA